MNTAHGVGEMIRGTINDGADKIGEGIASDGKTVGTDAQRQADLHASGHAPQNHQDTTKQGAQEIKQGVGALQGAGGQGEAH